MSHHFSVEHNRMPLLSVTAHKYRCIIMCNKCDFGKIFSVEGQIVNSRCSRLNPERNYNLIFLAKNLNNHND